MTGPRIDWYPWAGGREAVLRWGPDEGPTVIAAPALLEEGNRTRAATVDVLRRLAAAGIGGALPDLPGMGESVVPIEQATLAGWRAAFAACAAGLPGPVVVMSWRGGALVDAEAPAAGRWRLAPLNGAELVREWHRVRAAGGHRTTGDGMVDIAGNSLSILMLAEFDMAEPTAAGPCRTVRLEGDPRPADLYLSGRRLWRGIEPATDDGLQDAVASDLLAWIRSCVG